MRILHSKTFRKYFIPGIIFQSCVIAGGYGTGREFIEYFMGYGPVGGLLGICIVTLLTWSIVCAVSFSFAHAFKKYDYKSFMKGLMGPLWVVFEVCYIIFIITVLGVISASAGSVVSELFHITKWVGVVGMPIAVFLLVMTGSEMIENVLSFWSFVLYGVYFLFLVLVLARYGGAISLNMRAYPITGNWVMGGLQYAFYNMGIIIVALYTIRHCDTTKEAFSAGLIAGVIGILPGIMLFIGMISFYPVIMDKELPISFILKEMNMPWLQCLFQIVLFGTLIETGVGLIYAVTDRLEYACVVKGLSAPQWTTPVATISLLVTSTFMSAFGLIKLVAKGYGLLGWVFFILYLIPLMTIGLYKLFKLKYK